MFGTLNPKIPVTRASDSTLKWSARGLALNSTIVTSIATGDNYVYFNSSTGSVYAYLNISLLANTFIPYIGATADVNLGLFAFVSTTDGAYLYNTEYPGDQTFLLSYTNIVPGSVYCTHSRGNAYDGGDGYLYNNDDYQIMASVNYSTGYVNTVPYSGDYINDISYSYYPPVFTSSVSYGGSNFDNGITASKDTASQAAYFNDDRFLSIFSDGFRAALFQDTSSGQIVQLCSGIYAVYASAKSLFDDGITSIMLNDGTYAANATGNIIVYYSTSERVRYLLQNTDGTSTSGAILWKKGTIGYGDSDLWELGNDYNKNGGHDWFLYDYVNGEIRFIINDQKTLNYYGNIAVEGYSYFGDGGNSNYTRFDSEGHQTMEGTAKPWEDLRIEPSVRGTGANNPTFEKYYDDEAGTSRGVYLYSFDDAATNSQKEIFFTMQMPHEWDGGDIMMHVHWVGNNSDTDATPIWGLEYVWKDIGEVFGDTTIVYTTGENIDGSGTADPDVTAGKHYISAFSAITPGTTADGLSSILIGRLFRFSGDASDTYNVSGNKCGLLYIDAHYQKSSLGSNDEYSK